VAARVTLADVARAAGVSISTASRALSGRGELAPATRAAGIAAAEGLRFRPSLLARSLRNRRTDTVGFVVPDISSPFYAAVLHSAQELLEDAGYRLILMNSDRDVGEEVDALRTLLDHPVDGLLVATTGLQEAEFERVVGDLVPCVFFDGVLTGVGTGSVCVQNEEGMAILVGHLVEHGHSRIALLAGSETETSGIERARGFRAAVEANGLAVRPEYVRTCADWTLDGGRREAVALLALAELPTAVVGASDDLALGALAACRERRVAVPDELAVVSFDDPYFGELLAPPLTALRSQPRDVGRRAAELLIAGLAGEEAAERDVRLPVTIVRRRSCGCAG
jgi:LacI family transcriptional regulator